MMSSGNRYENRKKVGGDYFTLNKAKRGKKTLEDYLSMFNIDDYYLIKSTNSFRFIDETELEKYAGVLFLNKSIYSKKYLEKWLEFMKQLSARSSFLNNPFPPEYMLEKIKIIDEI